MVEVRLASGNIHGSLSSRLVPVLMTAERKLIPAHRLWQPLRNLGSSIQQGDSATVPLHTYQLATLHDVLVRLPCILTTKILSQALSDYTAYRNTTVYTFARVVLIASSQPHTIQVLHKQNIRPSVQSPNKRTRDWQWTCSPGTPKPSTLNLNSRK